MARSGGWKSRVGETGRERRVIAPRRAVEGKVPRDAPRSTGGQRLAPSGRHPVPSARRPVDLGQRTGGGAATDGLGKGRARNRWRRPAGSLGRLGSRGCRPGCGGRHGSGAAAAAQRLHACVTEPSGCWFGSSACARMLGAAATG